MKRIVIGVLIFVLMMAYCTFSGGGWESESKKQISVPTPVEVILASEDEAETLEIEEETTGEQLVDVEIIRKQYYPFWDFLEYGNNKEDYFQPDGGLMVEFKFNLEGYGYHCGVYLKSPSYRAFRDVFPELKTLKDEGYQAKISYQETGDCKHISIISINDSTGSKVWDYEKTKDPRFLAPLEEWSLMWAKLVGDDALVASLYDYQPKCDNTAGFLNECIRPFSPPEEFARIVAFNLKVTDPTQNVWVLNNFGCQSDYRWIDYKTGEVLQKRDVIANLWELPSSGWLALQINNDDIWETTYTVNMVGPGWVVSVNEEGELFEAAPIQYSQLDDFEKFSGR